MAIVKKIDEAVGIQWQGIGEEQAGNSYATGDVLIIGNFRRGRIDKPMKITQQNIRAELGYDFNNIDYQVVQAVLDMGVKAVNVMRVYEAKDSIGESLLMFEQQPDYILTDPDSIEILL